MKTFFRPIRLAPPAALAALAVLTAADAGAAQDTTTVVQLRATYEVGRLSGFVVLPFGGDAGLAEAAAAAAGIIRRDLDYSDRFEIREGTAGVRPSDPVDLGVWRERGADWVLQGSLAPRAGGTALRLTLHDAVYGTVKASRSFDLPPAGDRRFRMAVHAAADEVVRWVTGEPGAAASRIAFVLAGRGSKEIYLVDSDGENLTRVTSDGSLALSPAWSPDGSRLAYTSYRSGVPLLYERNLGAGGDRVLSDRIGLNITPAYAPDGRTVAFATTVGGATEIATVGSGGLQQQTRGRAGFANLSPTFSPDGSRIAFVSDRLGEPQIYVMRFPGGQPELLSEFGGGGRGYSTSPDWSPVGNRIAYHTRSGGGYQIVVAEADGGRPRVMTSGARSEDPSWAPDGRHLVFASERDGGGLFVLDTVTGRIRTLLRGRGYGLPDWSPALLRFPAGTR